MAGPIYKFFMFSVTEAWYQLSEEEQNNHRAKIHEAFEEVGGKRIVACRSAWSSEQWQFLGVEVFPDVEAVQKHTARLEELDHFRYVKSVSVLGIDLEPS